MTKPVLPPPNPRIVGTLEDKPTWSDRGSVYPPDEGGTFERVLDDTLHGMVLVVFATFAIFCAPVWVPLWAVGRVQRWWIERGETIHRDREWWRAR